MDRNEAIACLRSIITNKVSIHGGNEEAINMAIAALVDKDTNVPSKWIPVSERLPETSEDILILLDDYKNMSVGRYYAADGEWYADFGEGPFDGVVAWMPLPEPMKKVSWEPWEGETDGQTG